MSETNRRLQHNLRKGRHSQKSRVYFVTTTTVARTPWFQDPQMAQIMCQCMQRETCLIDARNLCWVVMPDHIHLLLELGDETLSKVIRRLKATSALKLNRELSRTGRFWAPCFYDHGVRREESIKDVARYIVGNPVHAGLVTKVGDYPYWNAVWL